MNVLRVVTAVYPGPTQPRRGHFVASLHRFLAHSFHSEVLAPRVFKGDPGEEQHPQLTVRRFRYRSGNRLPKAGRLSPTMLCSYLHSGTRAARRWWPKEDAERGGLVLAHWIVPAGWIAAGVARRLRLPLVLYGHGSDLHRYGQLPLFRPVISRLLRQAKLTVVASRELAEIAARLSARRASDFPVLPVGIESSFRAEDRPPLAPPPFRVLFVGDFLASKGFHRLLAAVKELVQRGLEVQLQVAGSGPQRQLFQSRDYPWLSDLGELDSQGVRQAMATSHLLMLPSRGEGTPLVVQEALAMRLPVASTEVGGIPDLFHHRSGWTRLRDGDPAEVAGCIEKLAAEGAQGVERRWQEMGANSTEELFAEAWAERLREVL
ncbi:MAG: glycosyltransferase, partial [Planctomycetota bacterium]